MQTDTDSYLMKKVAMAAGRNTTLHFIVLLLLHSFVIPEDRSRSCIDTTDPVNVSIYL